MHFALLESPIKKHCFKQWYTSYRFYLYTMTEYEFLLSLSHFNGDCLDDHFDKSMALQSMRAPYIVSRVILVAPYMAL